MYNFSLKVAKIFRPVLNQNWLISLAYWGLCAAYLQGGLNKLFDFSAAIAEMTHFGLAPAPFFAVIVIILELGASILIIFGVLRWLGALALAGFTFMATFIALRFWEMPVGPERFAAANSFFEHLGLVGGFLLVIWYDLKSKLDNSTHDNK
ncbi:MAG: DoxX family protein [Acinetobacter sp.]